MEYHSPLHLGVVAIEKGAFRLPTLLIYFYLNQKPMLLYFLNISESSDPYDKRGFFPNTSCVRTAVQLHFLGFIEKPLGQGMHPLSSNLWVK